jgi:serine/threonine-protein phosphatase 2A activator
MGTRAPWADGAVPAEPPAALNDTLPVGGGRAVSHAPPNRHTGQPVNALIPAEPALPSVNREEWPERWTPAKKWITSQADVQTALNGKTLHRFVSFTLSLNEAAIGVKLSDDCHVSPVTQALLNALASLSALCDQVAPVTHEVRYGNPAYRQWFQQMKDASPEMVYNLLGDELGQAILEILPYWLDSFGNCSRIDYGTGHETNFACFLFCLYALGALTDRDRQASVTRVFASYLLLMRKLQTTYWCARLALLQMFPPLGGPVPADSSMHAWTCDCTAMFALPT